MAVIQLKNVKVEFAGQIVLGAINLEIKKGECFVLIGPSGQGKTTLLKVMAGLISPQRGEVLIDNQNLSTQGGASLRGLQKKMGMLFQKNALFDSLTCGENIAFPLRETTTLSQGQVQEKVDVYLEAVGLSSTKDLFPDEISGGMQKRLGIARALALDPEIIFYDDPTAGLDPLTSRKIIELILNLRKQKGSTVIAITNDMNRAYQMADRIGMLVDGKLILTGNAEQTKKNTDPIVHQFVRGETLGPLGQETLGRDF